MIDKSKEEKDALINYIEGLILLEIEIDGKDNSMDTFRNKMDKLKPWVTEIINRPAQKKRTQWEVIACNLDTYMCLIEKYLQRNYKKREFKDLWKARWKLITIIDKYKTITSGEITKP